MCRIAPTILAAGIVAAASMFTAPASADDAKQPALSYSTWTKVCVETDQARGRLTCATHKEARFESGQQVLATTLIETSGSSKKTLRITFPLGMVLEPGTRLAIDQGKAHSARFVNCSTNGCISDYEASPELVSKLKTGQTLLAQAVIASSGQIFAGSMPLSDFAKAYDGPPTDPKVFGAQQKKLQEELQRRAEEARKKGQPPAQISSAPSVPTVTAAPATSTSQALGRRVALVIGNGAYRHATPLPNPANDAVDIGQALRELGFEVIEGRDLDWVGIRAKVKEFDAKLDNATMALFFYAGHGVQVDGRNYLVPVDAKLDRAGTLDQDAVDLLSILRPMEAEKRVNLVFLDACRDNPFTRSLARSLGASRSSAIAQGLAAIQKASGTLITYATEPGNVAADGEGRNSPFTAALLKHMRKPGLEIELMMKLVRVDVMKATGEKQLPKTDSGLLTEVFLKLTER